MDVTENISPEKDLDYRPKSAKTALIACGALAREILQIIRMNQLEHLALYCLPAKYHNTPNLICDAIEAKIHALQDDFDHFLIAYGDCGTGGALDRLCQKYNITRIDGAHCYSFFAGADVFDQLQEQEIGTFYLTDYLARHFDQLIMEGMGLNRYPEMRDMLFGNYTKLVYLAQSDDKALDKMAQEAAEKLQLSYERIATGYGLLTDFLTVK
jgi:hypothetical protein